MINSYIHNCNLAELHEVDSYVLTISQEEGSDWVLQVPKKIPWVSFYREREVYLDRSCIYDTETHNRSPQEV